MRKRIKKNNPQLNNKGVEYSETSKSERRRLESCGIFLV